MRKANLPLIIGGLILVLILAIIIFPGLFTGKSPYNMQRLIFSHTNGSLEVRSAPFPPSEDFVMGSDDLGRDIYSMIIHGTGLTILLGVLIAAGRFLIALPMAVSAGFGNNLSKSVIKQFGILFSAIPALLVSVIILKLDFFAGLAKGSSIAAFVIILSLVGWPKLGGLLMERVEEINRRPFIKGEVAVGKGRLKIALENVFPHLGAETIVLFFMEIARALSMVMQLGLFSIFVGLLKIILDTQNGVTFYNVSFEPEWSGMLASSRSLVTVAPWAILFPALAFFISVLGFNLFGEGLRNVLQRRDSMIVPRLRRLLTFDFKYIWKSTGLKSRIAFIAALLLTAAAVIVPVAAGDGYGIAVYEGHLPAYDMVIAGTDEASDVSSLIAAEMDALGLEPLENEYLLKYEFPKTCLVSEPGMTKSVQGMVSEYIYGEDYWFVSAVSGTFKGGVYDATREDMFNIKDFDRFDGKFILLDKSFYNDIALNHFIRQIGENADIKGILLKPGDNEKERGLLSVEGDGFPVALLSAGLAKEMTAGTEAVIEVSLDTEVLDTGGINIAGILRGEDKYLEEEAIVIAMRYNYTDEGGKDMLGFNLQLMHEVCALKKHSRSVIFMFIDGTLDELSNGFYSISDDFPYSTSKVKVFIDLTGIESVNFKNMEFGTAQSPFTRAYAWSLGRQMDREFNKRRIPVARPESINYGGEFYYWENDASNLMFWECGIATLVVSAEGSGEFDAYEIGSVILKTINNNNY